MIVCLDANLVIYVVESNPTWSPKALARVIALQSAGDEIAVSDAARLECLVKPFATKNLADEASYRTFFSSPTIRMLPITMSVWERAARIRALHSLPALDSIHLAAAVEHGCGLFLTNDNRLQAFPDIAMEILT